MREVSTESGRLKDFKHGIVNRLTGVPRLQFRLARRLEESDVVGGGEDGELAGAVLAGGWRVALNVEAGSRPAAAERQH